MTKKQERYHKYLKSGEWKYTKGKKLKQSNFKCDGCGESSGAMEVHHLTYERIGMELLTDLASYCINCHKIAHNKVDSSEWNKYLTMNSDVEPIEISVEDMSLMELINSI